MLASAFSVAISSADLARHLCAAQWRHMSGSRATGIGIELLAGENAREG